MKTKSPRAYCAGSANRGRCPAVKEDAITQKVTECCYRLRDRLFKKTMGKAYGTPASIEHDSSGSERETAPFSLLSAKYVLKLGISKSEFCRRTLLSEKTYERIKYGQLADRPKPETVMQFCVGLGLSLEESENLFNAAGHYLGGCKLHEAYRELLSMNDSLTIYECNDVLRHLELPLLARWIEIS